MINALTGMGYERNKDMKAAQLDWRLTLYDVPDWVTRTKKLIEQMYHESGNKSVIVVTYSLSCTHFYVFLTRMTRQWNSKFIRSVLYYGSMFGGCFAGLDVYFTQDIVTKRYPQERLVERTLPASPAFLPRKIAYDHVLIRSDSGTLGPSDRDYKTFYDQIGYPDAYQQWLDVKHQYDPSNLRSQGNFTSHCVSTPGHATRTSVTFKGPISQASAYLFDTEDGDGIVIRKSLRLCSRLGRPGIDLEYKEIRDPGATHDNMILRKSVINHLVQTVKDINDNQETFS